MLAQLCEYIQKHQIIQFIFKLSIFMVCELYQLKICFHIYLEVRSSFSYLYFQWPPTTNPSVLHIAGTQKIFESPFSHLVASDSLWPHRLQHTRLPCPSPSPGVCSNSCPLNWWCHPTISSSFIPFSYLQSFPALGSFVMSWLFASGGHSVGVSALASVFQWIFKFDFL